MLETIVGIIIDACENVETTDVSEETRLVEDLNISSLELLSVISELEDEFDIKISNRESRRLITVGDIVELIKSKQ